ncbi:hypothetical protein C0J52_11505 [Blattella germanica]|nr:hypothetical protein C0J52_11505 [Blattella germanica]
MDTGVNNLIQDPNVGVDFNSTNVFERGISSNSEGLECTVKNGQHVSLPQHNFTKAEAMKNCGTWVDSQCQLQEERRAKRKRTSSVDEDDTDSLDENEVGSVSMLSSMDSGRKRQRTKSVKMKNEHLELRCEWQDCDYMTNEMESFVRHVSAHISQLEIRMTDDDKGVYVCKWESCGFETTGTNEVVRHVNFHSYHTKIKCIGANVVSRQKLPPCTYDEDGRNLVPDLPDPFLCGWQNCDRIFNNSQMYFYHVQGHAENNPRGCKSVVRTTYKLIDHVRSHTQEKVAGCPTCGGLFSSKTKFFDHLKRQVPLEMQGYQCSHCSKYYPSKRLLRDHMRHHVNHYKCSFCDMTCPKPSSLSQHIRYRHLDSKPFKCDFCPYTAKSRYDMKYHTKTHCTDPLYYCEEEGCNFSCRSAHALNRHYKQDHRGEDEPLYCCHICDERFHRGYNLTRHLFVKHNFRWPSGHCRFRYKNDEDGFFRLQTVRYESLEVTQEMLESESGAPQQPTCRQYNLRRMNGQNSESVVFTLSEDEDDPEEQPVSGGRILISIEELDSSGNVVRRKVMEAEEVPIMPPGNVTLIEDGGEVE